jgi:hypothetical protein
MAYTFNFSPYQTITVPSVNMFVGIPLLSRTSMSLIFNSTNEIMTNSYALQSSCTRFKVAQTKVITILGVVPYSFRAIKLSHVAS